MKDPIEEYLDRNGPALSGEVASYLSDHVGMSPNAARKRVSRASGSVKRLAGITFPHKARFLYLESQFGSPWYWDHLRDALINTGSAYGYAIAALQQRDGIVSAERFSIVCGAPLKQRKHLSPDIISQRLSQAGLLSKVVIPGIGDCIALVQSAGHYDRFGGSMRAQAVTEDILLRAVKDWLRNLGIASYGKVAMRVGADLPKVGTFVWDLTAPSYLGHMVRKAADGSAKPGFVVCDAYLGGTMTNAGVRPFIRKCVTLRSLRRLGPCMQILIADRFQPDAFEELKKFGIVPATPENLFGREIADGLLQLTSVLESAAHAVIDPAQFDELFSKLGKIEGASNQLRGTLFEFLVADIVRKSTWPTIYMNRMFKAPDEAQAEADVVAVRDRHAIRVMECKGHNPLGRIPDSDFKRWLQHSVPVCFKAIKAHPDWKNLDVTFEFWATAPLSDEAMALFEDAKAKLNPRRYAIELRLGPEILRICRETKDDSVVTAFEKHFMRREKLTLF
jgi:hypothetical protein